MTSANLTPALAQTVASALHPSPRLLHYGTNALYRLGPATIARIGPAGLDATRTLHLVRAAHNAGVDVLQPISTTPRVRQGLEVTLWPYIPPPTPAADLDFTWLGATTRALHEASESIARHTRINYSPDQLVPWRLGSIAFRLGQASTADLVTTTQARDLERTAAQLKTVLGAAIWTHPVLAHGDLHIENVLPGPDGPRLIDFDGMRGAPRAWDLAPLGLQVRRFGLAPTALDDFATGYGADLREDPHFDHLVDLRQLSATVWCAAVSADIPAYRVEAQARLADPDHTWITSRQELPT